MIEPHCLVCGKYSDEVEIKTYSMDLKDKTDNKPPFRIWLCQECALELTNKNKQENNNVQN